MRKTETKYPLPIWLEGVVATDRFSKWLQRKAVCHVKRDVARGNSIATVSVYKKAIYDAVIHCKGVDAITHSAMDWGLIGSYRSDQAQKNGRDYKRLYFGLPTVDHLDDGLGQPDFQICRWDTNDCKNDLTDDELEAICIRILTAKGYDVTTSVNRR